MLAKLCFIHHHMDYKALSHHNSHHSNRHKIPFPWLIISYNSQFLCKQNVKKSLDCVYHVLLRFVGFCISLKAWDYFMGKRFCEEKVLWGKKGKMLGIYLCERGCCSFFCRSKHSSWDVKSVKFCLSNSDFFKFLFMKTLQGKNILKFAF